MAQTAKNSKEIEKWGTAIKTWTAAMGFQRRVFFDEDLAGVVREAAPHLLQGFLAFVRPIEKADFVRYALMYRDGGVYADMDQELSDPRGLLRLAASGFAVLPLEKVKQIGQSILVSPPNHSFWMGLMEDIVRRYDSNCYEIFTAGPGAISNFWKHSGGCSTWGPRNVAIASDLMAYRDAGSVTRGSALVWHRMTGTWRSRNAWLRKRRGPKHCSEHALKRQELCPCIYSVSALTAST